MSSQSKQLKAPFLFHQGRRQTAATSTGCAFALSPLGSLVHAQRRTIWGGVTRHLLSSLEASANRNPTSAAAQNMFYQALLRANMPAIVAERYSNGQFAKNAACDAAYQVAVARLGTPGAVEAAHASGLGSDQIRAISQAVAAQSRDLTSAVTRTHVPNAGTASPSAPLHIVVGETWGSLLFKYFKYVTMVALVFYFATAAFNILIENLSSVNKMGAGKGISEAKAEHQKVRFGDVHGCDEAKDELQELVQFLKAPDKFSALGGKLPKGVLLVGPPGTGKTLLARAVAGEAGVPFFYMSGSEFDEVFVGVGAKRVRELFAAAKGKSPAIIFIDELDAIGAKRNPRDGAYAKQTLNQLLTELDGFEQNSGVIILAATNFPESLDKALTRPGRFDRNVIVDLPDVRGRMAILKHHMKKVQAGTDVILEHLASGTPGFSGADLENVVNQAAVHASKNKAKLVSMKDFEWAKDKIIMGSERKSMVMSEQEREMTAYHEAGHALICMYNPQTDPLYKVTIMPRGNALGLTTHLPEMDKYSVTTAQYQGKLDVCMGGKVAEEMQYGTDNVTSGCSSVSTIALGVNYN